MRPAGRHVQLFDAWAVGKCPIEVLEDDRSLSARARDVGTVTSELPLKTRGESSGETRPLDIRTQVRNVRGGLRGPPRACRLVTDG